MLFEVLCRNDGRNCHGLLIACTDVSMLYRYDHIWVWDIYIYRYLCIHIYIIICIYTHFILHSTAEFANSKHFAAWIPLCFCEWLKTTDCCLASQPSTSGIDMSRNQCIPPKRKLLAKQAPPNTMLVSLFFNLHAGYAPGGHLACRQPAAYRSGPEQSPPGNRVGSLGSSGGFQAYI